MPEISIIVPVYNAQKTINKCIDSILQQSFADFELILINDGSTDNSIAICYEYARKDCRIKVIHKENQGVSHTRNVGLENATGKYIQFIDSDDWIEETMLEKMISFMTKETDMVMCGYTRVLLDESCYRKEKEVYAEKAVGIKTKQFLNAISYYFEIGIIQALWNKLFRRELIENYNIKFNENLSLGEDLLFNIEYIRNCNEIANTNDILYNYVIFNDNESLSTKFNPKRLEAQLIMYTSIIDILNKFGQFEGKNRKYFKSTFSSAIIGSIKNYLSKCEGSQLDKRNYLRLLYQDKRIMKNILMFGNGSIIKNIIAILFLLKCQGALILISEKKLA